MDESVPEPHGARVPEHSDSHASSSHEPSSEPLRRVGTGSHIICSHFPKDWNLEICQRTNITRAPCRRRIGGVVHRSENVVTYVQRIRGAAQQRRQLSSRTQTEWSFSGYEEKNIDSVIQYIYTLGGTAQMIVPVLPEPELSTPPTTQTADQKRKRWIVHEPE